MNDDKGYNIVDYSKYYTEFATKNNMEFVEDMYNIMQTSTIIMQAKIEVDISPGNNIYDPSRHGLQIVYAMLFKTNDGIYGIIAPDFLNLNHEYSKCGQFGNINLMLKVLGDIEDYAINEFKMTVSVI